MIERIGKISLMPQILIAFVLAVLAGIIFGPHMDVVQPLGDLFLRLIQFIIVPLIVSSLITGVASTGSMETLGRIGGKTILYYVSTTFVAVSIGLIASALFTPGKGVDMSTSRDVPEATETDGVISVLLNIIPTNPIESLSSGNILQIIFFSIFIGIGITMVGQKADPVYRFFDGFAEIMYKITWVIMKLIPIGVFGLLAPIIGEYGMSVLMPLIKLISVVAVACIIHAFFTYSIAVKAFAKMNPLTFFKGIAPASLVAFSTQSSSGTLPVTIKSSEDNLGVSKKISSFILPLGATINMDGTSLYLSVAALFTAQAYGVELSFAQIMLIVLIGTLGSIGAAGVPGAGLVMLTLVLTTLNLPLEAIALIAGVDRFMDMFRTAVNITGDASGAVVINATERHLDDYTSPDNEAG
ncbi:dicarboxylate:amino acid:cation symporter DAACS family protein [Lentibacillus kapialis]|uniref:Dicarboxylate:amino acid:cation symporter DAACS family protein n=1 Tax=Lentibacillus kapialis TaxID=340214 RepID=A0A917PYJ2_9BACI|nr:dicarboxylate/amino acid:cation symporter [Lentibacillus kapialis]GGJ99888.1 dicarboxylate:amino acid:cation symporter DAACS family protein [Lentibacillus kapialis]